MMYVCLQDNPLGLTDAPFVAVCDISVIVHVSMYLGASALYIYQEGRSHVQCSFYRYMYTKGQIKLVFYFSSDCQQAGIKMILMKSNL